MSGIKQTKHMTPKEKCEDSKKYIKNNKCPQIFSMAVEKYKNITYTRFQYKNIYGHNYA